MKKLLQKIPLLNWIAANVLLRMTRTFPGSEVYWEQRYLKGGNSGLGSYGKLAQFKAKIINQFVAENNVKSVIEFGCGDGNQLQLAKYPHYLGFDISETAVSLCRKRFSSDSTKEFYLMKNYNGEEAELSLSLDVIYHLVEDNIFENHMRTLFNASYRYVIIYSSNFDLRRRNGSMHVRHRKFTDWIIANVPNWKIKECHKGSYAIFYIYEKNSTHSLPL